VAAPKFEVLTANRFFLELKLKNSKEPIDGYFMECQGFKRSQELIEICEVTPEKWGQHNSSVGRVVRTKIPGNMKSENITLRRGMTISTTLWNWFKTVEEGGWATERKDGDLVIYDQAANEKARFRFEGAWPTSYKISDVKADSSEFEIEELELAVDRFIRIK
jgi:phage tail-like protein